MEHLYIDESGEFERDAVQPWTSLVGGFVTTAAPSALVERLRGLHSALRADPELGKFVGPRPDLHGRDLLPRLDRAGLVHAFWAKVAAHLRQLPSVRLVAVHYVRDADVLVGVAADGRAFNRFLRMWQTLVRNVVHLQPWPAPASPAEVAVTTAQRSFPLDELADKDRVLAQAHQASRFQDRREAVRVADLAQLPHLLRGLADRRSHAIHARRLAAAQVSTPVADDWPALEREPARAGLVLADLACGLLRWTVAGEAVGLDVPPAFRIAYDPGWERYEWLCEAAPISLDALVDLLDLASRPEPAASRVEGWIRAVGAELARALARAGGGRTALRRLLVEACRAELETKQGSYPRCAIVFASGALPPLDPAGASKGDVFDEQLARLAFANHSGRDVDGGAVRRLVEDHLADDVDLLLGHGESLAHVAVGLRDEFDYDESVRVLKPWVERAHLILGALEPEARWTTYGRVASCLAQNYAFRQAPGDLGRALELHRAVKVHLGGARDLGQWACHAGNLAVVAGDDALLQEALEHLFGAAGVPEIMGALEGKRFLPDEFPVRLFAFTVASRAAALGTSPMCTSLRAAFMEPARWAHLVENLEGCARTHPLELYARHLLELCPPDRDAAPALEIALEAARGEARVPSLSRAATLAAAARLSFRGGRADEGSELARRALAECMIPFEHNPWCSFSTFAPPDYDDTEGWFTSSLRALQRRAGSDEVDGFLERFRFEWR